MVKRNKSKKSKKIKKDKKCKGGSISINEPLIKNEDKVKVMLKDLLIKIDLNQGQLTDLNINKKKFYR